VFDEGNQSTDSFFLGIGRAEYFCVAPPTAFLNRCGIRIFVAPYSITVAEEVVIRRRPGYLRTPVVILREHVQTVLLQFGLMDHRNEPPARYDAARWFRDERSRVLHAVFEPMTAGMRGPPNRFAVSTIGI